MQAREDASASVRALLDLSGRLEAARQPGSAGETSAQHHSNPQSTASGTSHKVSSGCPRRLRTVRQCQQGHSLPTLSPAASWKLKPCTEPGGNGWAACLQISVTVLTKADTRSVHVVLPVLRMSCSIDAARGSGSQACMQGHMPDTPSQGSSWQDDLDTRHASIEITIARSRARRAAIVALDKVGPAAEHAIACPCVPPSKALLHELDHPMDVPCRTQDQGLG